MGGYIIAAGDRVMSNNSISLALENVSVALNEQKILKNISLQIEGGECVGIIGPNGAGKSTLLRTMAGITQAETGNVRVNNTVLNVMDRTARARAIAYLPQSPPVYWAMSVRAIVALGRVAFQNQHCGNTIDDAMSAAGIAHFSDRPFDTLSGGEAARVHFARLLAGGSDIMLADEPIASLDPSYQFSILETLESRAADGKITIAALHDLALAARYCTRLIVMNAGSIVADGKPAEILTEDVCADVFDIRVEIKDHDNVKYWEFSPR